jgi:hypothetical protein
LAYQQTPQAKVLHARRNRRYDKTPKGRAARKRGRQAQKLKGNRSKYDRRSRQRNPEKYFARKEVYKAIRRGEIPHATTQNCAVCGIQAEQHHHPNGYSLEKIFDIVPLCKPCHYKEHQA